MDKKRIDLPPKGASGVRDLGLNIMVRSHTQKGLPLSSPQLYSHTECQQMLHPPSRNLEVCVLEKQKGKCYGTQRHLMSELGMGQRN